MNFTRRRFLETWTSAGAYLLTMPLLGCTEGGGTDGSGVAGSGNGSSGTGSGGGSVSPALSFTAPQEGALHAATWMVFGATVSAWGDDAGVTVAKTDGSTDVLLSRNVAREDLLRIAAQVSRFEPVTMLVDTPRRVNNNLGDQDLASANSFLVNMVSSTGPKNTLQLWSSPVTPTTTLSPYDVDANGVPLGHILVGLPSSGTNAGQPLPAINNGRIHFARVPVNDLWARDTGPVFVKGSDSKIYGANFNFNGWGQGFGPNNDGLALSSNNANGLRLSTGLASQYVFDTVKYGPYNATTGLGGVEFAAIDGDMNVAFAISSLSGTTALSSWLTLEGGAVELSGNGLAIMAQSCVLNGNRNPGKTAADVATELKRVLGVQKIYWVPGVKSQEITDDHIDFHMRFASASALDTITNIVAVWDGGTLLKTDTKPTSPDGLNLQALLASLPGGSVQSTTAEENITFYGVANPSVRVWQPVPAGITPAVIMLGNITISQINVANLAAALQTKNQINIVLLPWPDYAKAKVAVNARSTGINGSLLTYRSSFDTTFAASYIGYYETSQCIVMSQYGDVANDLLAFQILQTLYPDRYLIQIVTDGISNAGGTIHCSTQQQIA